MNFLVTGATGFVGGAVARHLVARGHDVRALVRTGRDRQALLTAGMEPVEGDLLDSSSLERAATGVDGIFHAAALYTFWTRRRGDIYDVNVTGTEAVLDAARAAGVRRLVFTSSSGTLRSAGRDGLADETFHAEVDELPDDYHRSKLLAERAALAANGPDLEVVVVNPTTPVGPGDVKPTPTGRIVLEFLGRRLPGYVQAWINLVDVEDVAAGHLAAFERGTPGERYVLGGENTSLSGAFSMLAEATGLRRRPIRIPYLLALGLALADELIEGRWLRRSPYIPLGGIRAIRHPVHVDCGKARRELGYAPGPVTAALGRAARWFVENSYVRARGLSPVDPVESGL